MTNGVMPHVSIVVIGHNEQKNLENCLIALNNMQYPRELLEVIYVDSNSTDNSIKIAEKYADKLFSLNSIWPTAGEAFNKGIFESSHEFVHITAGDIVMDKFYLMEAIRTLLERKDIAAVTGYFEEQKPEGWNKLMSFRRLEDDRLVDHFVRTPNGGTFRKEALFKVDGYDERIKKGQEAELGYRFAEAGLKILHKGIIQGNHDFDLNSFHDFASRHYKNGVSSGYLLMLSIKERSKKSIIEQSKPARKNFVKMSGMVTILLALSYYNILWGLVWLILYNFYIVASIIFNGRNMPKQYSYYRLINHCFSFVNYFGIISFLVGYVINKLRGFEFISKRVGLNGIKRSE